MFDVMPSSNGEELESQGPGSRVEAALVILNEFIRQAHYTAQRNGMLIDELDDDQMFLGQLLASESMALAGLTAIARFLVEVERARTEGDP